MAKFQVVLDSGQTVDLLDVDLDPEFDIPRDIHTRGILKSLRIIMEVPEGESILTAATLLMRRLKRAEQRHHGNVDLEI